MLYVMGSCWKAPVVLEVEGGRNLETFSKNVASDLPFRLLDRVHNMDGTNKMHALNQIDLIHN